jgi:hypothetical protein
MKTFAMSTLLAVVLLSLVGRQMSQAHPEAAQAKPAASSSSSDPTRKASDNPFTPEIEKFVETFTPAGEGIDGAGDTPAPSPEESLRHFTVAED